jgi:hypothetical protein
VAARNIWFQQPDGRLGDRLSMEERDLVHATDMNGDGHVDLTSGSVVMLHRFEI